MKNLTSTIYKPHHRTMPSFHRNSGVTRLFLGMAICFLGTAVVRRSLPSQIHVLMPAQIMDAEEAKALADAANTTNSTTNGTNATTEEETTEQQRLEEQAQRKKRRQKPPPITYFKHGKHDSLLRERYCVWDSQQEECCSLDHCDTVVKRSTLYSECCNNVHIHDNSTGHNQRSRIFPLLITSGPRSGTSFMHQLVTRSGLYGLTKETRTPTHMGMVSWKHVFARDEYFSGTKSVTHLFNSKFKVIWHLVRDPLRSLTSIAFTEPLWEDSDHSRNYIDYVSSHIPLTNKTTLMRRFGISEDELEDVLHHRMMNKNRNPKLEQFLIYRGLEIYLYWHGFINELNVPVFRLEDVTVDKNVTILDNVFRSIGREGPSHEKVFAMLEAQEEHLDPHVLLQPKQATPQSQSQNQTQLPQNRRRLSFGANDLQLTTRGSRIRKGSRLHRETLSWQEICRVSRHKARSLLRMSQSFGYYMDIYRESLCT